MRGVKQDILRLTPEQEKIHLNASGMFCPHCLTFNTHSTRTHFDGRGRIFQEMRCRWCEATWEDEYTLTGVVGGKEPLGL